MLLSLNETRDRVRVFASGRAGDTSQRTGSETFWDETLTLRWPAEKKKPASRKRNTEESL